MFGKNNPSQIDKPGFEARRQRGRSNEGACLPVQPPAGEMPASYGKFLADLKQRIASRRLRIVLSANAEMIMLYWEIGKSILKRQDAEGWGAKVIDRLSADLCETFPDMKGLSSRNLLFMRSFAEAYPRVQIVKQLVSQLPWGEYGG